MGLIEIEYSGEVEINIDEYLDQASTEAMIKQVLYNGIQLENLFDEIDLNEFVELMQSKLNINDAAKLEAFIKTLSIQ